MPPTSRHKTLGRTERALQIEHSKECQHLVAYRPSWDGQLAAVERAINRLRLTMDRNANERIVGFLMSQLVFEAAQIEYNPFHIVFDLTGRCPSSVHPVSLRSLEPVSGRQGGLSDVFSCVPPGSSLFRR